ncbi:MAG TPA: hypothetical protein IGS53_18875 [Leptolyngbyaceae cyanobacterium M33_DOE_097]|nr:hypothetical protein [Leptolyngbyaceae cyanobacterium M33_DOE_097]
MSLTLRSPTEGAGEVRRWLFKSDRPDSSPAELCSVNNSRQRSVLRNHLL